MTAVAQIAWSENTDYLLFQRNLNIIYEMYKKLDVNAAPLRDVDPGRIRAWIETAKFYPRVFMSSAQKKQIMQESKLFMEECREVDKLLQKRIAKK